MPVEGESETVPAVVRKYANRRLYDTAASHYVTLADLRRRVRAGDPFRVIEARGGADITRQVLGQMLLDGENDPHRSVLDEAALAQLLRVQGRHERGMLSAFLVDALDRFAGERRPRGAKNAKPSGRAKEGVARPAANRVTPDAPAPDRVRHVTDRLDALQSRLRRLIEPDA